MIRITLKGKFNNLKKKLFAISTDCNFLPTLDHSASSSGLNQVKICWASFKEVVVLQPHLRMSYVFFFSSFIFCTMQFEVTFLQTLERPIYTKA